MSLLTLSSFSRRRTPVLSSSGRALLAFVLAPFVVAPLPFPLPFPCPFACKSTAPQGATQQGNASLDDLRPAAGFVVTNFCDCTSSKAAGYAGAKTLRKGALLGVRSLQANQSFPAFQGDERPDNKPASKRPVCFSKQALLSAQGLKMLTCDAPFLEWVPAGRTGGGCRCSSGTASMICCRITVCSASHSPYGRILVYFSFICTTRPYISTKDCSMPHVVQSTQSCSINGLLDIPLLNNPRRWYAVCTRTQ